MKCMKCGGETYRSTNTEAVELDGGGLLVIRRIPCFQCRDCDEIFYTGDVVEQLERITAAAKSLAQEFTVIVYPQAA